MTRLDDDILITDEESFFAPEESVQEDTTPCVQAEPWKLLIADDDDEVHTLTRLVLSGFVFEGRGLEFLSAHSGRETVEMLREHPETALVLLDVVMERDDAGLQAVHDIRNDLDNHFVRIILRTGQPGQAPEHDVIANYDYKAKTELTSQKLYTTVTAALRAYRDLRTIERQRSGLEMVNAASQRLFLCQDSDEFAAEVLEQMSAMLTATATGMPEGIRGVLTAFNNQSCLVVAGTGQYLGKTDIATKDVLEGHDKDVMRRVKEDRFEQILEDGYACFLESRGGAEGLLLLRQDGSLTDLQRDLLRTYAVNVRIAYDNIHLNREIVDTQKEVIHTLGEVVESRSQETAHHVKRVGYSSYLLAKLAGLPEDEAKLLRMAAPLHDVGKIGIPDAILNKPGRLTEEERSIMQTHAVIGYKVLGDSSRPIFQTASIVAHEHHEKWDGSGYPRGLSGEDIHIFGRIVGLVDVFDALRHQRVYKPAFTIEKCVKILREESGRHFEPRLVDLFLDNLDDFINFDDAQAIPAESEDELQPA
jgi:response regulator RpfG family c-di-GMP phosphodiesterase